MDNLKELSRADRFELQILGRLKLEGSSAPAESCLCNTINISTTGALVETGFVVSIGALIKDSFTLPGTEKNLEVTGEIVRGDASGESLRRVRPGIESPRKLQRYGIMFLDLSDNDRKAIEEFLSFYRKRSQEHQKL